MQPTRSGSAHVHLRTNSQNLVQASTQRRTASKARFQHAGQARQQFRSHRVARRAAKVSSLFRLRGGYPASDSPVIVLCRRPDRQSAKIVELGEQLLQSGSLTSLGDDLWSFLEQLCIAALDVGRWELAEVCVARLHARFPESSRMSALQGMLLEARGEYSKALGFYDQLLQVDETDMVNTSFSTLASLTKPAANFVPLSKDHLKTADSSAQISSGKRRAWWTS